mgnify:CR=1 FL=1
MTRAKLEILKARAALNKVAQSNVIDLFTGKQKPEDKIPSSSTLSEQDTEKAKEEGSQIAQSILDEIAVEEQEIIERGREYLHTILDGKSFEYKQLALETFERHIKEPHTVTAAKKKKKPHGGKPKKVVEIADAIRRDNKKISDEAAYRMAWETYCSYTNPSHDGCTSKGKSKRKSPKSER